MPGHRRYHRGIGRGFRRRDDKNVLDAALIAAAQSVEHYEIARYGTLIAWAKSLGRDDCARILNETLAEEKAADEMFTQVAEHGINQAAA